MRILDLEEIAEKIGWKEKQADKLIVSNEIVAVIEETGRPKLDDIVKLEKTIQALRQGILRTYLRVNPRKIIAIIHAERRDAMIPKILRHKTRKDTIYCKASCNKEVHTILREHGIQ